jgi:hypothetical protein
MLGQEGLDHHVAPELAPSRSTGYLAQQLERSLARAEVRKVQAYIGIDHPYKRDSGEIQTLRDHLGAQQDVHLPAPHPPQNLVVSPLS